MTERGSEAYWDERYADRDALWGAGPNRFLVEYLADLPAGRALDLASGQGRNAIWLAEQGHHVTAVELSGVASQQARALAESRGVEVDFVHADAFTWDPGDRRFDLIVLSYLQLPEELRRAIHSRIRDWLAPGGRVFVVAHHVDNLTEGVGGPPTADVLFTEDDLASDFSGLSIDLLQRVLRPVELEDGTRADAIDVVLLASSTA